MDLLQQALLNTFQEDTPSALEVKCNKEHGNTHNAHNDFLDITPSELNIGQDDLLKMLHDADVNDVILSDTCNTAAVHDASDFCSVNNNLTDSGFCSDTSLSWFGTESSISGTESSLQQAVLGSAHDETDVYDSHISFGRYSWNSQYNDTPQLTCLHSQETQSQGYHSTWQTSNQNQISIQPEYHTSSWSNCQYNTNKQHQQPLLQSMTSDAIHTFYDPGSMSHHYESSCETQQQGPSSLSSHRSTEDKPLESYVALVAKALMSSPSNEFVLGGIYDCLLEKYPYFRTAKCAWRSSVRHALSTNECFMKNGRSKNGRGFLWAIHPLCLNDFHRGDFNRRQARKRVQQLSRKMKRHSDKPSSVSPGEHYTPVPMPPVVDQSYYTPMTSTPYRESHTHQMHTINYEQQLPATSAVHRFKQISLEEDNSCYYADLPSPF